MRLIPRRRRHRHEETRRPAPAPEPPTRRRKEPRTVEQRAARVRRLGVAILIPVGMLSAAYSYKGVYARTEAVFGERGAYGFPILLDGMIAAASCMYISGAMVGQRRQFWRLTAHGAIAGTILANALSTPRPSDLLWHIVGPIVWSVVVEGTAREVTGEWKATHRTEFARIPRRLWLASPRSFVRCWRATIRMHRLGLENYRAAFDGIDAIDAAVRLSVARGVEGDSLKLLKEYLRSGALPPRQIMPVLEDRAKGPEEITAEACRRVLERDEIARADEERAEVERVQREAAAEQERLQRERVAAEERRRIAAQLADAERLERLATEERERRERQDLERRQRGSGGERGREERPTHQTPPPPAAAAGRRPWSEPELDWITEQLQAALDAGGEQPGGKAIQDLAAEERPDLGIHTRPPVSVRGKVGALWEKLQNAPVADAPSGDSEEGTVLRLAAGSRS